MKSRLTQLLPLAVLLLAQVSVASEQSERLCSRGLIEFHTAHYTEALQLFDQAVRADPADVYARYYRGVTAGRLRNYAAAISDLRAVVTQAPTLEEAPLELGIALLQSNAPADALPWLQRAQGNPDTDAPASLYLGIAHLRLGQFAGAHASFAHAAAADPTLDLAVHYYQGVTAFREAQWKAAETQFTAVVNMSPDSAMGREARAFLSKLHEARPGGQRRYHLYASAGFQYDSNVVLAPSNEVLKSQLGISRQADGRAVLSAGGIYTPWQTDRSALSVGYEAYQTLHFKLTDFDIQDHRINVQLVHQVGRFQLGILGRYDYYFLKDQSFLQEATALPWLTLPEGRTGRTEVYYRMRRRDFLDQRFSLRNAFNHSAGARQYLYLGAPERYVALGYRYDHEAPVTHDIAAKSFEYDGHELDAGVGWVLPHGIAAEVDYAYRRQSYAAESRLNGATGDAAIDGREDDEHLIIVALHRQLTPWLGITAAYFGNLNNSNDLRYDYERHIASFTAEVSY
jgi:tetratricopeptide (TPR) repeat protein